MQTREHPDELTPREREVLDFLRLGLTNEEIAQRLGISLDGAKYHVSQILSKLGVATREEAATVAPAPSRRWWVAVPLAAKAAGAAIMVVAVAGLGVLTWGVLNAGSGTEAGGRATLQQGDVPNPPANVRVVGSSLEWDDQSSNEDGFHTYAYCEEGVTGLNLLTGLDVPADSTSLSQFSTSQGSLPGVISNCPAGVSAFNATGESEIAWDVATLTIYGTLAEFDEADQVLTIRASGSDRGLGAKLTRTSLIEEQGAVLDPTRGPRVGDVVRATIRLSPPAERSSPTPPSGRAA